MFHQITQRFYRPEVDLFATRAKHRLPWYVSRYPDPGAIATDAFLCDWGQLRSWVYAPLVLMPRIIQKIKRDAVTALTGTILEGPTMVPEPFRVIGGLPMTVTTDFAPDHSPLQAREGTPTSTFTAVDCIACVWQHYRADRLSEMATNVLLLSWSESTWL